MSSDTLSTTLRCLNHFWSPWATRPSMVSRPSVRALRRTALGRGRRRLLLVAWIEDALGTLLLAALDDHPVLGDEDRDGVAADDVVLLPDPGVALEHHALVELVVLGAPGGAGAAVARDDPHVAGGHGAQDLVLLLVEVH